ncbi:hypothetical protein [Cupriavidus neocaledonicus]|uniref:Transmembrane protein n=1 Tax=Cupriavidus neocaledonicus TaxID=1040979 RepID=A0A375H905_9BURK|nr:hypothetical protein [Cupriavidus neocaledonicus]SOZ36497.1 conserved hypothetical protein; putative membrane protein [Cupriavidus neocaledonicus]SPD48481.1 conserved membrane protein of unknown function [Cupriavidus neocaledonicus]
MYSRLPSTYELLEALAAASPEAAPAPHSRPGRALWLGFIAALVATILCGAGLAVWRLGLKQPVPLWSLRGFEALLGLAAACYVGAGLARAGTVLARLRHPLRWQAAELDRDNAAENALLRRLARIPPQQLQARQRRVALQLRLWEGAARTLAVLLALAPAAAVMAALPPRQAVGGTLLWLYGVMVVTGAACYLYLHLQCSRTLRRLAHVLGEAAELNAQLGKRTAGAG